jgi:hypothetical protein
MEAPDTAASEIALTTNPDRLKVGSTSPPTLPLSSSPPPPPPPPQADIAMKLTPIKNRIIIFIFISLVEFLRPFLISHTSPKATVAVFPVYYS